MKKELDIIQGDRESNCSWYLSKQGGAHKINTHDITLLINIINKIIKHDFSKINKLVKYLRNVAKLFNILNLPI